jgi:hypothetical protein
VKQSARAVVHALVTVVKEEKSMCVCTCMSLAITTGRYMSYVGAK